MALTAKLTLNLRNTNDVLWARQEIKRFAARLAFSPTDLNRIEVATSELACNMVKHAGGGRLLVSELARDGHTGLEIVAVDEGPGIPDLERALTAGFSTTGSFGDGLPAVQELMDKFEITTEPRRGTRVVVEKWAT